MKAKTLLITVLLGMFACTSKNNSQVDEAQNEKVVQEIELVINSISEGWKNLNVEKAFKESFIESSEYIYVGIDGEMMNFDDFLVKHLPYLIPLKNQNLKY